ncbi:hypothetical protein F5B22DRAFT_588442 [Xylaria bambusicola]|uniref:uncharacterized protein n=1 Tax=Xylaria bambusicola TaxID=326684 RepID=UPI0020081DDC|nr:uncharacterized protein F5B22DRAFT_588442 [Xylaria bambusicola]KAI0525951.1 hypothetical protein F5B22DRAFT_588442 [Xylaria bambusicola]
MMDRNPPEAGDALTTKSNGQQNNTRPSGNRRTPKRGTGNSESKENNATSDTDKGARAIPQPIYTSIRGHRQTESLTENRFASPNRSTRLDRSVNSFGTPVQSRSTRIPRPASSSIDSHRRDAPAHRETSPDNPTDHSSPMRQPMDLKAAFKRAQEQTAAEANSDTDNTIDLQHAFDMANAEFNGIRGIDGSPSPAPRSFRRESRIAIPTRNGTGTRNNDLKQHLQRFDRNHQLAGIDSPLDGLFAKNRARPSPSKTGHSLRRKPSNSSLSGNRERRNTEVQPISVENQGQAEDYGTLVREPPVGVDVPVPSIEYESASDNRSSPDFRPADLSPEKSMNWHLDADFTAGDLQFSQSPRIPIGKQTVDPGHITSEPVTRQNNERLNQIQRREIEAAKVTFPEEPVVRQMNHKLEEIRAREMEASSRRALAASRLEEIRMRNSEPRSVSPELQNDSHEKLLEKGLAKRNMGRQRSPNPEIDPELRGEAIRDTPVVIFKKSTDRIRNSGEEHSVLENDNQRIPLSRNDSHDLLRRLARATSSSPREDQQKVEKDKDAPMAEKAEIKQLSEIRNLNRSPAPREERGRLRNLEIKNPRDRPTVGFADLIRTRSGDSAAEKRRSTSTSEADPTDRIAAELNLFAPLDNYSEKGSIRAPSPVPSEPVDEKTPRPPKIDPLTQPTPRVVGAYVETPATVRVKEEEGHIGTESTAQSQISRSSPPKGAPNTGAATRARALQRPGPRSSSLPTASRRSRSSSRRRRPLINTAKPPTVKDDIIAILRANNIDDSTLENLDSILADHDIDDLELKQMVNDSTLKAEDDLDVKISQASDRDRELEVYDRMSKSLQTGLLGIRSAKKGIERLEDKVTHKTAAADQPDIKAVPDVGPLPQPSVSGDGATPILITVPKLYRKDPKFKLTTLGVVAICAIAWYVLECTFSSLYAGPDYICTPTIPCDWSRNEPYFPYTMPFMLDEWTTGGRGRALAFKVGDEVGDILAEISDWVTNTDFTQFDERYMDAWQRKRHRRRLRKHGLVPKWKETPGYQARFADWQIAKAAREWAQELGLGDDETMSADEIVR